MKKLFLIAVILFTVIRAGAQQFWIENWTGTNCAQGCTSYSGPNGPWSVVKTGYNGTDSNAWYFSEMESGEGRGICGNGQQAPSTAHVSFTSKARYLMRLYPAPDQGAIMDDTAGTPSSQTNLRLQSPVINCTGKVGIILSFNYIMGNSGGHDSATVWYFNGVLWSLLASPPPTNNGLCSGQGLWTYYSVHLPPSANNNANVKIGFNWHNDTLAYDDIYLKTHFIPVVSFAVDSIILANTPCVPLNVNIQVNKEITPCFGDTSGSATATATNGTAPFTYSWAPYGGTRDTAVKLGAATYTVNVTDVNGCTGSSTVTLTQPSQVIVSFSNITQPTGPSWNNGSATASVSGGIPPYPYSWTGGQTSITVTGLSAGNYQCCVTDANGCTGCDSLNLTNSTASVQNVNAGSQNVELYPNPANNSINLVFAEALNSKSKITITDLAGRIIGDEMVTTYSNKTITLDISGLAQGIYFVKVSSGMNEFYSRFIKQ